MCFRDHAGVNVPATESARLDVLRAKGFGQIHRSPDVIGIGLGLDAAALLFINRPVAVELKAAIADAWSRKCSGSNVAPIVDQRSNGCTLLTNRSAAEINTPGHQVGPVGVP